MQTIACPNCTQQMQNDATLAGLLVACPRCGGQFYMPSIIATPVPVQLQGNPQPGSTPTINVFMSQQVGMGGQYGGQGASSSGISTPLLISAISNLVVGLFWFSTLIGVVLAIPMFILCIFEFVLYSRVGNEPVERSASSAKIIAIFEIVVGLFNLPTLICGIVLLINASSVASRSRQSAARSHQLSMPTVASAQSAPPVQRQRQVPPPPRIRP